MKPIVSSRFFASCAAARITVTFAAISALASSAYADSATWNGTADALWSNLGNWSGPPITVPGTLDTATFNNAGGISDTISLGASVTLTSLIFDTSAAAAYTIGSGAVGSQTLTLDNTAAITVNSSVTTAQTFNSAITLGTAATGTTTITNNGSAALTFAGNITGGTGGTLTTADVKTLAIEGTGNVIFSGNLSKGTQADRLQITKAGSGILYLTGQTALETAAGATALTLTSGTIDLGTTGTLTITGSASPVPASISGSGTITGGTISLIATINSTGILAIDSQLANIGGGFTGGGFGTNYTTILTNANNSFTQNIGIGNGSLSVSSFGALGGGSSISLGGSNGNVSSFIFTGAGGTLSRSITLSGGTSSQGTINQSGTGLLKITGAVTGTTINTLTLTGSASGSGELSGGIAGGATKLAKSGTGTWTLSGDNTYTGATTLNAGTLKLDYAANDNNKLSDTRGLILNGGTLDLAGSATAYNEVVSYAGISGGTTLITRSSGNAVLDMGQINSLTQSMTTNATTTVTIADTSVLRVGMPITGTGIPSNTTIASIVDGTTITISAAATTSVTNTATLGTAIAGAVNFSAANIAKTLTANTNGILSQRATVGGTNFAMVTGSNIVAYDYATSGVMNYTGGAMATNTNYALQTAGGTDTLGNNTIATSNTLKIANTAIGTLAVEGNTLDVGALLFSGSADYSITTTGSGRVSPSALLNYGSGTLTLGSLGAALTQYGTGKTILSAAAGGDYAMAINGGTVQFSNNLQIGTNATVKAITLNNGTLQANTAGTIALNSGGLLSRTLSIGEGGGTLDIIGGGTLSVTGVVSSVSSNAPLLIGSGNTNGGKIELTAANTYTGGTVINGDILAANNTTGSATGTGAVTVNNGGTFGGSGTTTGAVTINAGGTLAPGNSIESLATGDLSLVAAAIYAYEMDKSAAAGVAGDLTAVTGSLTLDLTNAAILTLTELGISDAWAVNDKLTLISYTTTWNGGLFKYLGNTVADGSNIAFSGMNWLFDYNDTVEGTNYAGDSNGTFVTMKAVSAIPEPAATLLGGIGMLFLLRRRRA